VTQKYVGPSNWAFLKRVKQHAGERVVLGSGDLFSAPDIVNMLDQTGVDGVTVARGCIGNPWIFREVRALLTGKPLPPPPTVAEQRVVIEEHYRLALDTYGEGVTPRIMRKFGIKYAQLHPQHADVRNAFAAARSSADWLAVLDAWYDPTRAWPPVMRRAHGDLVTTEDCL
jgi:tRNA-dihydrouridine synthase